MQQTSTDVTALILSFGHMLDQLSGQRVNKEWKRLVDRHPSLLCSIDLGNPQRFPFPVENLHSILTKGGSRVRSLRICTFHYQRLTLDVDVVEAVKVVVKNLEQLTLVGHVPKNNLKNPLFPAVNVPFLLRILKTSRAPSLRVILETCPCCVNWFEECVTMANTNNPTNDVARLSVWSPICHFVGNFFCVKCAKIVRWARYCPICRYFSSCSECSFEWRWSPELSKDTCQCDLCVVRTHNIKNTPHLLDPPLWNCTLHCQKHNLKC